MPIISKDNKCVTLINVFTVEPSNQKKLISVRLGLPRIIRLKENAPELDNSSFLRQNG
jgi:hypothetical protein